MTMYSPLIIRLIKHFSKAAKRRFRVPGKQRQLRTSLLQAVFYFLKRFPLFSVEILVAMITLH